MFRIREENSCLLSTYSCLWAPRFTYFISSVFSTFKVDKQKPREGKRLPLVTQPLGGRIRTEPWYPGLLVQGFLSTGFSSPPWGGLGVVAHSWPGPVLSIEPWFPPSILLPLYLCFQDFLWLVCSRLLLTQEVAPCSTSAWHWSSHSAHPIQSANILSSRGRSSLRLTHLGTCCQTWICRRQIREVMSSFLGRAMAPRAEVSAEGPSAEGGRWWARSPVLGPVRREVHPPSLVEKWRPEATGSSLGARTVRACESLKHSSVPHLSCFRSPSTFPEGVCVWGVNSLKAGLQGKERKTAGYQCYFCTQNRSGES